MLMIERVLISLAVQRDHLPGETHQMNTSLKLSGNERERQFLHRDSFTREGIEDTVCKSMSANPTHGKQSGKKKKKKKKTAYLAEFSLITASIYLKLQSRLCNINSNIILKHGMITDHFDYFAPSMMICLRCNHVPYGAHFFCCWIHRQASASPFSTKAIT